MRIKEIISEYAKVKMSHDPNNFGTYVTDRPSNEKIVMLPINRLVGFEPDSKMDSPVSAKNLTSIISSIRKGNEMPAILVRKIGPIQYQILDGHHRFAAYKALGIKKIPCRIISKVNVSDI